MNSSENRYGRATNAFNGWESTATSLPSGAALVWCDGRFAVAQLVEVDGETPAFIDSTGEQILAWPSHWMALPEPPAD